MMIEWLALCVLIVCGIVGFAAIFFTTFGTLIILLGAVSYAAMTGMRVVTWETLLVLGILYGCGEVLEYVCTFVGAKKMGATTAAAWGALVGGVFGALIGIGTVGVGLIPGTLVGLFLGAFLVQWTVSQDLGQSFKAGLGGLLGRVGAILIKVVIAIIMFAIIATQLLSPY